VLQNVQIKVVSGGTMMGARGVIENSFIEFSPNSAEFEFKFT
jgi:hypothetical protein